ncbi:MAG TPA: prepilin-type N-terminal cleavage/methylation domain-containing protein [Methylophilaceae bacterium]|jgi:prepilin-type N-terminal cleavage/methylation domain-containing protein|nr:prepilin-type N-terminal cleavage/methylation domain-containing protein [Methylophilaceae bacterium]
MSISATFPRQRGFSLVELMVALAIGMFILVGLVYVTGSTINSNAKQLKTTRLNQELRSIMHLTTRDLKRAGQVAASPDNLTFSTYQCLILSATSGTSITVTASPTDTCAVTSTSSFDPQLVTAAAVADSSGVVIMATTLGLNNVTTYACGLVTAASTSSLTINNVACPNAGSAVSFPSTTISRWHFANMFSSSLMATLDDNTDTILDGMTYRYDLNGNGVLDYPSECFGMRWNSASLRMESWVGSNSSNCTAGAWNSLTDTDTIEITDFRIVLVSPSTSNLREYRLSMTGRLKADNSVSRTIEEIVRLRNDPVI